MAQIRTHYLRAIAGWFLGGSFFFLATVCCMAGDVTSSSQPIWRLETAARVVALTFDDGPKPERSLPILDILDRYGVKATFFVVGKEAAQHPDIVWRMYESGHDIGNHSYRHQSFDTLSFKRAAQDLEKANHVVKEIVGVPPLLFRSPGGTSTPRVYQIAKRAGLTLVNWTINASDYVVPHETGLSRESGEEAASRIEALVARELVPGAIILFHNGGEGTERALPRVLNLLKKRGYRCVTLSEWLGKPSYFSRLPHYRQVYAR